MSKLLGSALLAGKVAQEKKDQIKLAHCTGDFVVGLAQATADADTNYVVARDLLSKNRAALWALRDEVREFTMLSCDVLKPIFGRSYSERWDIAGFKGSLASPMKPEPLIALVDKLAIFFAGRPELEIPSRNVTSAAAKVLSERLTAAVFAVNSQADTTVGLKQQRDAKFEALRKCMRNMIEELNILLDPLDSHWKAFGFNQPGAKQTPETPTDVEVKVTGDIGNVTWPAAPRAEYYRVWMKVEGVDAEPVPIGSPSDLDFMVEELPGQKTIEFYVSAVNSGGESGLSEAVIIRRDG